ncbi:MAG: hypothetical protein AAFN10_26210, partial [Bacteroidota bacterium]
MKARIALFLCLVGLLFIGKQSRAQGVSFFSTEPSEFYQEFSTVLTNANDEKGREAAAMLASVWNDSTTSTTAKEAFISLVNIMVSKRYRTDQELAYFTTVYGLVSRGESYVRLEQKDFMEITLQAVTTMERKRVARYLRTLYDYIPEGIALKRDKFRWQISQNIPQLTMVEVPAADGPAYQAPVLRYTDTDLNYKSQRDSTHIAGTQGEFNLIGLTFVGNKGRVDWTKMGLDSADVYCNFRDYKLNFHYGLIKVDTVDFYYNSLIEEPLVG